MEEEGSLEVVLSTNKFIRDMEVTSTYYDLVVNKVDEEKPSQVLKEITEIIKSYQDITLKNLLYFH